MNGYENFEQANDEDVEDEQSSGEGEGNFLFDSSIIYQKRFRN
jgi:hypothetical protein